MGSLVFGLFLGVVASFVLGFIGSFIYDNLYETWAEIVCIITTVVLCLASTISITLSMCSYEKLQSTCYVERYEVTKETIEKSIASDKISSMERLQLVQNAIDENKHLTQQQFDCQQWYGFLIDKDVLELETIDFD